MSPVEYVCDIPLRVRLELCTLLDANEESWVELASHIEVAASSISMYQREYQRPGGSPTECLLRDWSHSNATVLQLLTHLQRMSNVAGIKLLRDCVPRTAYDQAMDALGVPMDER